MSQSIISTLQIMQKDMPTIICMGEDVKKYARIHIHLQTRKLVRSTEKYKAPISNMHTLHLVQSVMRSSPHTLIYVDIRPKILPANLYGAPLTNAACIFIFRPLNITSWSV